MRVKQIMKREVCVGSLDTNAATAAEMMWGKNCGFLPVEEQGGRIVGTVTDRDLFIALGTQNRRPADLTLREVMQPNPAVCAPGDDVRQALKTMATARVSRLPVAEGGVLQGVISIDDVVAAAGQSMKEEILQTIRSISEAHIALQH